MDKKTGLYKRKSKTEFTANVVGTTIYTTRSNAYAGRRRWFERRDFLLSIEEIEIIEVTVSVGREEKRIPWYKKLRRRS